MPMRKRMLLVQVALCCSSARVSSHPTLASIPPFIPSLPPRGGGDGAAVVAPQARQRQRTRGQSSLTLTSAERFLAGGISRAISQVILYPIDALRTLAQTRGGRTLADVGSSALLRGCATTSSFALFIGALQFSIFGATRPHVGPVMASALGAAGSCLVSIPQEVIKQRLVTGVYSTFRGAVVEILRTDGLRGFYSAWRPTMARNVPFVIVTFVTMDVLRQKRLLAKHPRGDGDENDAAGGELSAWENCVIGVSSALVAAVITNPADVVKTRMMTQQASIEIPYASTVDCIQTIWKTEGLRAFYLGFGRRSLYMGPLWASQFALNGHFTKQMLERRKVINAALEKVGNKQ